MVEVLSQQHIFANLLFVKCTFVNKVQVWFCPVPHYMEHTVKTLENFVRLTLSSSPICVPLGFKPLFFSSRATLIFITYTGSGSSNLLQEKNTAYVIYKILVRNFAVIWSSHHIIEANKMHLISDAIYNWHTTLMLLILILQSANVNLQTVILIYCFATIELKQPALRFSYWHFCRNHIVRPFMVWDESFGIHFITHVFSLPKCFFLQRTNGVLTVLRTFFFSCSSRKRLGFYLGRNYFIFPVC